MPKLTLNIKNCNACFYHIDTDGIWGFADWCKHPKVNKNRGAKQICGKDLSRKFPSFCPLIKKKK